MVCDCEFMHDGDALPLSIAIGVAMIGADDTPESVMERADAEMYRRKAAA
jgi:GGDEF domain-containing protein